MPDFGPAAPPRRRFRPALLDALRGYRLADLGSDLTAGVVVAAVAIPLAIAFAIASLAPAGDAAQAAPQIGLVTIVVAGTVAALAGGSRYLVTGPTGAFIVVLAKVVQDHGLDGLLLASLLAGVMLLLAGAFRLGQVIKFIPYPVTTGFTAGIAVVIFLGQLPDLLGVSLVDAPTEPLLRAGRVLAVLAQGLWSPWALAVAVGTVIVIQGVKRLVPRVPGPVVALVLFTAMAAFAAPHFAPADDLVTVADRYEVPSGLPAPRIVPGLLSWASIREVLPSAFTIFLLGAIESLLAAVVADGMTRTHHDSNQELMGQGLANIASPFFGGIAATGALARTAASIQNGARSPLASLIHVAVVVAVLFSLSGLAGLIPLACLAGVLVVVAWNMSEHHQFRKILKMPRQDAGVLLATFAITVAVDLTWAVGVGLLLSAAVFLHRMSEMTHVKAVDPLAEPNPAEPRFKPEDIPPGVLVYSIDGPFFFGAANQFADVLARVSDPPKVVVMRLRNVPYLDATGLHALEAAVEGLHRRGTRVMLSAIQSQPLDMLERSGLVRMVGDDNVFRDTSSALRESRLHLGLPPLAAGT